MVTEFSLPLIHLEWLAEFRRYVAWRQLSEDDQLTFFSGAINMLNLAVQYFLYGFHLVI